MEIGDTVTIHKARTTRFVGEPGVVVAFAGLNREYAVVRTCGIELLVLLENLEEK